MLRNWMKIILLAFLFCFLFTPLGYSYNPPRLVYPRTKDLGCGGRECKWEYTCYKLWGWYPVCSSVYTCKQHCSSVKVGIKNLITGGVNCECVKGRCGAQCSEGERRCDLDKCILPPLLPKIECHSTSECKRKYGECYVCVFAGTTRSYCAPSVRGTYCGTRTRSCRSFCSGPRKCTYRRRTAVCTRTCDGKGNCRDCTPSCGSYTCTSCCAGSECSVEGSTESCSICEGRKTVPGIKTCEGLYYTCSGEACEITFKRRNACFYGEWSTCRRTGTPRCVKGKCGAECSEGEVERRTVKCGGGKCAGTKIQERKCRADCTWGPWKDVTNCSSEGEVCYSGYWSDCKRTSVTACKGTRTRRYKVCDSQGKCTKWKEDKESCNMPVGTSCGTPYAIGDKCYCNFVCDGKGNCKHTTYQPKPSTYYVGSPVCYYDCKVECTDRGWVRRDCKTCSLKSHCVGNTRYYNGRCTSRGCVFDREECPAGWVCSDGECKPTCEIGSVCKYGNWQCDGSCRRKRGVYIYNSACQCVFDHWEYENAPKGTHCSQGSFTSVGYCGSSSVYCSGDRYVKVDRFECDGNNRCNVFDYSDTLKDCGPTSYTCKSSCVKTYRYTCSAGRCGRYSKDYNCPRDTSCSNGKCSSSIACSTRSFRCKDSCTKARPQYRCDGRGNCNRFWKWVDSTSCNPFSCSAGECTSICSSACGADSACDNKKPGDPCGVGKKCDSSCRCVAVECIGYTTESSCNADPNCAWCRGDNTCKSKDQVKCQPGQCLNSKFKCSSSCTWQDCGSRDDSCYCSGGECVACDSRCLNYKCVECLSDADCPYCYQKCDISTHTCYDFRPQLTGTCKYYDYCDSVTCSTDSNYCYNVDPTKCADSSRRCHAWFSC